METSSMINTQILFKLIAMILGSLQIIIIPWAVWATEEINTVKKSDAIQTVLQERTAKDYEEIKKELKAISYEIRQLNLK